MNRTLITSAVCTLAGALIASAQVPSLINYQGRLTDSNGTPVTGSKTFAISIYDAATGGNLLYSESIGAVTLDSNGVYSFQFGNSGTSNKQVTETIGTTTGSTLSYTKTLSSTPIVANSITVTDGTNSWSQSVGNPGTGASATANTIAGFVIGATITSAGSGYTSAPAVSITGNGSGATATATISNGAVTGITITNAGSGYTTGATITIAPPVIPFRVDYSGGAITATYSSAPSSGRTISATYRCGTSGITGALSGGAEHWMAISVDGTSQATRQRVLAVPYSLKSAVADYASDSVDSVARRQLSEMLTSINAGRSIELNKTLVSNKNYSGNLIQASYHGGFTFTGSSSGTFQVSPEPSSSKTADYFLITPGFGTSSGWYEIEYSDGQLIRNSLTSAAQILLPNPQPQKQIAYLRGAVSSAPYQAAVTAAIFTQEDAQASYTILNSPDVARGAITVYSANGSPITNAKITLNLQDGRSLTTDSGFYVDLGSPITSVTVSAQSPAFNSSFSTIKLNY